MIGKLFRSRPQERSERPSFRPTLESLENRQVPSVADVSAAFDALPTDMSNLTTSLAARDINGVAANLSIVSNDIHTLIFGAAAFQIPSRLQIDNALVTAGIQLIFQGFNTFPAIPSSQFVQIERLGGEAVEQGAFDFLVTGFFPQSSGDGVLT
jgi:hypothetical protein